jgi:hypothetical protein
MSEGKIESPNLKWALWYLEKMNFSVIPIIPGDKKPLIQWQKYQKVRASRDQVVEWWTKTPNANVGVVTGAISDLDVIDIDTDEGRSNIEAYISDGFVSPLVHTPRGGQHHYCRHQEGMTNKAGVIQGTDFRGEGGYVLAPPSVNGNGKAYKWGVDLKIGTTPIPSLPSLYIKALKESTLGGGLKGGGLEKDVKQSLQFLQFLQEGTRDKDIFHTINCLSKGGFEKELAYIIAERIAKTCSPPFPLVDARVKVDSAYGRHERTEKNVTQDFRDYCSLQDSYINLTDAYETLQFLQASEKAACQVAAHRMCKEGLLEKVSRGCFKRIEKDCADIDIFSDATEPIDIRYPLGVHELVITHPKNIIVIAGEANAGKTAYLLNFAQMNCGKGHEVVYFSSEMGAIELKARLKKFNLPMDEWQKIVWKERASDFAQMIRPNAINIIDFLEVHDEFYKVGLFIKQIFDKLDKGIAFIALQKNKGRDEGLGGGRSLEKARVYMAMEPGRLKLVKAKNWRHDEINPNGISKRYKLVAGCNFKPEKDKNGSPVDWVKE